MSERIDIAAVDAIVARVGTSPDCAVPILQAIQHRWRYLPAGALRRVCELTEITPAQIAGVSTFYSQFRHRPAGRHTIRVCVGTACHVKGADRIHDAMRSHLEIAEGADTDAAGEFTLERVACLGCCTLAPVVQIDDVTYGHLTADGAGRVVEDFRRLAARRTKQGSAAPPSRPPVGEIRVSMDTCCLAAGSAEVWEALRRAIADTGAAAVLKRVGCQGMSYIEPLVEVVAPDGSPMIYAGVKGQDAAGIIARHFAPAGVLKRLGCAASRALGSLVSDYRNEDLRRFAADVRDATLDAYRDPQVRVTTEQAGRIDPTDLDAYRESGGLRAVEDVLRKLSPDDVIGRIRDAGLRGRGGAGYPSWRKWSHVRWMDVPAKVIICNGDEGDPGAFMDRMLLEAHPLRVLEGLVIAAYAVGASEGVVYVRAEYPIAVTRVTEAIAKLEQAGLLGENILGMGYALRLRVVEGAGAFVCGEETALIAGIEGRRGTPRLRPPYPAEHGLFGRPTLVNNVETFATVPWIIRNGPERFAAMGTETSKGTKVFALAGKVRRGGMIEVPMGISIRRIVEEIGGGVNEGRTLKAVQIGGPSGGCVPAALMDAPIDYEALREVGAMMGSGGMVVLDDTDCMVDIARYFLQFTQNESCGRCTFCRVGTRRMLEILERLCAGQGRPDDIDRLEWLSRSVRAGSICGLGRTAPNPVLSTLAHFRDEYEAHAAGKCPAKKCRALIAFTINDNCIGCTKCAQACPSGAIDMRPYEQHEIDPDKCVRCGACRDACPSDAVDVE